MYFYDKLNGFRKNEILINFSTGSSALVAFLIFRFWLIETGRIAVISHFRNTSDRYRSEFWFTVIR